MYSSSVDIVIIMVIKIKIKGYLHNTLSLSLGKKQRLSRIKKAVQPLK